MRFAQVETIFLKPPVLRALACIFSANFSQTRGTPKNSVGRISRNVSPKLPARASGRANAKVHGRDIFAVVQRGRKTNTNIVRKTHTKNIPTRFKGNITAHSRFGKLKHCQQTQSPIADAING